MLEISSRAKLYVYVQEKVTESGSRLTVNNIQERERSGNCLVTNNNYCVIRLMRDLVYELSHVYT